MKITLSDLNLTKEEFEELYYSNTNKEIIELYNIKMCSLVYLVNQLGIPKKLPGWSYKNNPYLTEERKQKIFEKYSKVSKEVHSNIVGEQKKEMYQKIANANKNKSSEEKEIIKQKRRATKLQKYNDPTYNGSEKAKQTKNNMSDEEKTEYYNKLAIQSKRVWAERTAEEKQAILDSAFTTKKENHTFNKTKLEDKIKLFLFQKFGETDICIQYQDKRYHRNDGYLYLCDFYIKSLDLFIEINGFFQHGPHLFNKNNPEDLNLLTKIKEKQTASKVQYVKYEKIWTQIDVDKYNIAKLNNLNYILIYPYSSLQESIDSSLSTNIDLIKELYNCLK